MEGVGVDIIALISDTSWQCLNRFPFDVIVDVCLFIVVALDDDLSSSGLYSVASFTSPLSVSITLTPLKVRCS